MIKVAKIISGGQTGVDRAALDIAMELQIDHGGWCPRNRHAEDGVIPKKYKLKETYQSEYIVRTRKNVEDSDGTFLIYYREISGGTLNTRRFAQRLSKPFFLIDASQKKLPKEEFETWLAEHHITILNIAGPRASSSPVLNNIIHGILRNLFY